jgi:hypothetical protein
VLFYTPEEVDAVRTQYPGFWIAEIALPGAACLVAVPPTSQNAERPVPGAEILRGAELDGVSFKPYCRRCRARHLNDCTDREHCPGKTMRMS